MLRIEYFDKERFMRQLSASHGSVLLHLDNGKICDLKKDATACSMLQMMDTAPKKGFDLTVTDPADVTGFLRYMLEAGRTVHSRSLRLFSVFSLPQTARPRKLSGKTGKTPAPA